MLNEFSNPDFIFLSSVLLIPAFAITRLLLFVGRSNGGYYVFLGFAVCILDPLSSFRELHSFGYHIKEGLVGDPEVVIGNVLGIFGGILGLILFLVLLCFCLRHIIYVLKSFIQFLLIFEDVDFIKSEGVSEHKETGHQKENIK